MNLNRRQLLLLGIIGAHLGLLLAGRFALSWPAGTPSSHPIAVALFLLGGLEIELLTVWLVFGGTRFLLRIPAAGLGILAAWYLSLPAGTPMDRYDVQITQQIFISQGTFLDAMLFGSMLVPLGLLRLWGVRACSIELCQNLSQPILKFSLRGLLLLMAAIDCAALSTG